MLEEIDSAFSRKSEQRMRNAVARFRSILQHLREYTDGTMRKEISRHILLLEELTAKNSENFTFEIGVIRSGLHGVVESCVDFEIKLPWRTPDDG